jgi:hypothetical protein
MRPEAGKLDPAKGSGGTSNVQWAGLADAASQSPCSREFWLGP